MSETAGHIDPAILVEYEGGELDTMQRASVEDHLDTCGACRAELALAQEAMSRVVGATLGAHSESLKAKFHQRLDARLGDAASASAAGRTSRSPAPRRSPSRMTYGLLAASIAVLALGVYQMREPSGPTDLGQTMRDGASTDQLSLVAERTALGEWQLGFEIDDALRDLALVVTTSDGKLALERPLVGDRVSLTSADLGEFAGAEALFVQIVGVDALGNQVRSRPERLP